MRQRLLLLPVAALVIAGLCTWKLTRPPQRQVIPRDTPGTAMPAPDFELPDQGRDVGTAEEPRTEPSHRVRLKTYLGRHEILLAFFDGDLGADQDPTLKLLNSRYESLQNRGIVVLGVTTALPQQNRQAARKAGGVPFSLLTDVDGTVCAHWGCLEVRDDGTRRTKPALFLIDRAGRIRWGERLPIPESDPAKTIESLAEGS